MLDCCASGYCAAYEAASDWEREGYGDREFYGITLISESDVEGGEPESVLWNPLLWFPGIGNIRTF